MQTIFPILRYNDARHAIRWLCHSFGFVEVFTVPEVGDVVRHARLKLGKNQIMIGTVRSDDGLASPEALGTATQGLYVYVGDVEAHFDRTRTSGAAIISPPKDTNFGTREYYVRDLEGHVWVFGNYQAGEDEGPVR